MQLDKIALPRSNARGRPRSPTSAGEVAARIKSRRDELNLSVEFISQSIGISKNQYSYLERQCSPGAQSTYLLAIAHCLKTSVEYLAIGTLSKKDERDSTKTPSTTQDASSAESRTALGLRARDRREVLGLRVQELAVALNVSSSSITTQERRLNARRNEELEAKWENILQTPRGWLREKDSPSPTPIPRRHQKQLAETVQDEIVGICNWLSTQELIHRTFDEKSLSQRSATLSTILQMRYGVFGEEKSTLEAIGAHFSLTRERIRQLVLPMTKRAAGVKFDTPLLDKLKEAVQAIAPSTVEQLEAGTRPILGKELSLLSASRFANDILNLSIADFTSLSSRKRTFATMVTTNAADTLPEESIKRLITLSKGMVRGSGLANAEQIVDSVSAEAINSISRGSLSRAIESIDGFEWIGKESGWFWFGPEFETRLSRFARKIFSASQTTVSVEEIFKGMQSSADAAVEKIPTDAFRTALCRFAWLEEAGPSALRATSYINPAVELSAVEQAICGAIRLHNGVATKSQIDSYVMKTLSVAQVSVNVTLSKSPVLTQPGRGQYSIRGLKP